MQEIHLQRNFNLFGGAVTCSPEWGGAFWNFRHYSSSTKCFCVTDVYVDNMDPFEYNHVGRGGGGAGRVYLYSDVQVEQVGTY